MYTNANITNFYISVFPYLFFFNCWANYKLQTNYDNYKLKGKWLLVQPTKTKKLLVSSSLSLFYIFYLHAFSLLLIFLTNWQVCSFQESSFHFRKSEKTVLIEDLKDLCFVRQFYHRFLCLCNHLQPSRKISFLQKLTYQSRTINLNGATLKKGFKI